MEENSVDAYAPDQIAARVHDTGVAKARLPALQVLPLAVLAGAFIGLGAAFSTLSVTDLEIGYGLTRVLAGVTFSLGLILVVEGGAELFTGNNLIAMAWASGSISSGELLRNWMLVLAGNFAGAVATAALVAGSGVWKAADGGFGTLAVRVAAAKCELPLAEAFFRGVLCNALVCLAVWLCFGARTATGKAVAIVFPITAFVALGFEHSIANMYFIPIGLLLEGRLELAASLEASGAGLEALGGAGFLRNLVPVTLGNIVGGTGLVAGVYWLVYLRPARR